MRKITKICRTRAFLVGAFSSFDQNRDGKIPLLGIKNRKNYWFYRLAVFGRIGLLETIYYRELDPSYGSRKNGKIEGKEPT
jgi:hypothetical protein